MSLEMFMALLLVAFTLVELIWATIIRRTNSINKKIISEERIREHFAKLRQELMRLANSKKIDMNSYTFKMFYRIQTFILRRPDKYSQIGNFLADVIFKEPGETNPLLEEESHTWNDEIKSVALKTVQGLAILIEEFAPWRKLFSKLQAMMLVALVDYVLAPEVKTIETARTRMIEMSGGEAAVPA